MIASGYPGLEIIAKLARVLEVEPAELLRVPRRITLSMDRSHRGPSIEGSRQHQDGGVCAPNEERTLGGSMSIPFTPPARRVLAFNCPLCAAYAAQTWWEAFGAVKGRSGTQLLADLEASFCAHCEKYSLWLQTRMIFPDVGSAPLPNQDLPPGALTDYEEAQSILSKSPRGAAALLRRAIQKLCAHLGEPGKNINEDIASLVRKGLPVQVQQALDAIR
jgi:hypothetical protein